MNTLESIKNKTAHYEMMRKKGHKPAKPTFGQLPVCGTGCTFASWENRASMIWQQMDNNDGSSPYDGLKGRDYTITAGV